MWTFVGVRQQASAQGAVCPSCRRLWPGSRASRRNSQRFDEGVAARSSARRRRRDVRRVPLTWVRTTSIHDLVNVARPLAVPGQVTTRHTPGKRGPKSATQITLARGGQLLVVRRLRAELPRRSASRTAVTSTTDSSPAARFDNPSRWRSAFSRTCPPDPTDGHAALGCSGTVRPTALSSADAVSRRQLGR